MKKIFILLVLSLFLFSGCTISSNGNWTFPFNTFKGAIDMHDADVHNVWINHFFFRNIGTYELTNTANQGDIYIVVNSTIGLAVGDYLHIGEKVNHEHAPVVIKVITGNNLTINRPLDKEHLVGSKLYEVDINLASTGGTLQNPVSYKCKPNGNITWHIKKLKLICLDNQEGDFTNFCGASPLTNGLVLREYDGVTNSYTTYFTGSSNGEFIGGSDDFNFLSKTGGGLYAFDATLYLDRVGVAFKINGTAGDYLEILVQNGTTVAESLTFSCAGHVEGQ